jgi:hypothetical protein
MFQIMCLVTVIGIFSISARKANKSKGLWISIGVMIYFILGFAFLKLSEIYIIPAYTIEDTFAFELPKQLLSIASALIIITVSYIVQKIFLSKR